MSNKQDKLRQRKLRVRASLRNKSAGRPRLSVFRSNKHISVQLIDDEKGVTLVAASTNEKDIRASVKNGATIEAAKAVGKLIAERAKKVKVSQVVFDRGGYFFHGRVKALAESAREAGMEF